MDSKKFARALALALLIVADASYARESQTRAETSVADPASESGPVLFGSVGGGYGWVSSQAYSENPSGPAALAGASVSWRLSDWVLDAGLGWLYSSISGTTSNGVAAAIRTRAGLAQASARYRLGEHWQLGPVADLTFGADTRPEPSVADSSVSPFLGLRGVYETKVGKSTLLRGFVQASSRVAVGDGTVMLALAGIEIGLPLGARQSSASASEVAPIVATETAPEPSPVPISAYVPDAAVRDSVKFISSTGELTLVLDSQKIFFRTNSTALRKGVVDTLRSTGEYLRAHPEACSTIEINGHADRRGKRSHNIQLSLLRARSVATALGSSKSVKGKKASKPLKNRVDVHGRGPDQPLDPRNTPAAWALNRRVDLVFHGVKDPKELIRRMRPLLRQRPGDSI